MATDQDDPPGRPSRKCWREAGHDSDLPGKSVDNPKKNKDVLDIQIFQLDIFMSIF